MKNENKTAREIIPGVSLLEHTSDIGIHVTAPDTSRLMEKSALGMMALIMGGQGPCLGMSLINKKMLIDGMNREELLNNFLSELLYLLDGEGLLLTGFDQCAFEDGMLHCQARFAFLKDAGLTINTPVKAVTHHKMNIKKIDGVFHVDIIFDV